MALCTPFKLHSKVNIPLLLQCYLVFTLFLCLWKNKIKYLTKEGSQKIIMLLSGDVVTKYCARSNHKLENAVNT
jgi:hypothetical protein